MTGAVWVATEAASIAPPPTSIRPASARRTRPAAERTSTPVSGRSAASGATLVVARVGSQAASRVTTTPTANAPPVQSGSMAAAPMSAYQWRTSAIRP